VVAAIAISVSVQRVGYLVPEAEVNLDNFNVGYRES